MKYLPLILFVWAFAACKSNSTSVLEAKVDSLNKLISKSYKPGLGEFMSDIQVHHAKIYFAGKNENWPLADFEVGEIKESLEAINKYCTDRPEIKSLPIIYPALDSLNNAIKARSLKRFEKSFELLTISCNSCHKTTSHAFNVIKIPDSPPFSNQEFKVK